MLISGRKGLTPVTVVLDIKRSLIKVIQTEKKLKTFFD